MHLYGTCPSIICTHNIWMLHNCVVSTPHVEPTNKFGITIHPILWPSTHQHTSMKNLSWLGCGWTMNHSWVSKILTF
jgi:hypothetical protein